MPAQERLIRTASNNEKIFTIYEYTDDNRDRNGIYYFEINKNQKYTDPQLVEEYRRTSSTPLVKHDVYEELPLSQLYLDVNDDFLSITFVPKEPGRPSGKKAYSGKIVDGSFKMCPNQPRQADGDIVKVNTDFTNPPNKLAIKIFELEEGNILIRTWIEILKIKKITSFQLHIIFHFILSYYI